MCQGQRRLQLERLRLLPLRNLDGLPVKILGFDVGTVGTCEQRMSDEPEEQRFQPPFRLLPRESQTFLAGLQRGVDVAQMQLGLGEKRLEPKGRIQGTSPSHCVDRSVQLCELSTSPFVLLDDGEGSKGHPNRVHERKPLLRRKRDRRVGVPLGGVRFAAKLVHYAGRLRREALTIRMRDFPRSGLALNATGQGLIGIPECPEGRSQPHYPRHLGVEVVEGWSSTARRYVIQSDGFVEIHASRREMAQW